MSKDRTCDVCMADCSSDPYFSGEGYWCKECHEKVVDKFNALVDGDAGYTINNDVGVSLSSIKNLLNMLEYQPSLCRWVITDQKRLEVLDKS